MAASAYQRDHVMTLPKDACRLPRPSAPPGPGLAFWEMGVQFRGLKSNFPQTVSSSIRRDEGMGVCGKERPCASRWPFLQREAASYLVTAVSSSLRSLQLLLEECPRVFCLSLKLCFLMAIHLVYPVSKIAIVSLTSCYSWP